MQLQMCCIQRLQVARIIIGFMQITNRMDSFLSTVQIADLRFFIVQLARSSIGEPDAIACCTGVFMVGTYLDIHFLCIYKLMPFPTHKKLELHMKNLTRTLLALSCALALSACNKQETPAEVQSDVNEAQVEAQADVTEAASDAIGTAAEGTQDIADASGDRSDVNDAATDAMEDNAKARYDVEIAKADGELKVAKEKCDALASNMQDACDKTADAAYETAKAAAVTQRDAKEASAEAMKK